MQEKISIKVGEIAYGKGNVKISTDSIGSCIVVCLYDKVNHIGGMLHAMLPINSANKKEDIIKKNPGEKNKMYTKYVVSGIDLLYKKLLELGAEKQAIKAKLVGGAAMFKSLIDDEHAIGNKNIEAARQKLGELGVAIKSEDTGGNIGRTAEFFIANAVLNVNTKI